MNAYTASTANMMAMIILIWMSNNISKYTDISSISPLYMPKFMVSKRKRINPDVTGFLCLV